MAFLTRMRVGDYVVTTNEGIGHIGAVDGPAVIIHGEDAGAELSAGDMAKRRHADGT